MKITSATTEVFRWPRPRPIRNGKYVYTHASLNVVRVHTDEGITGIGEASSTGGGGSVIV